MNRNEEYCELGRFMLPKEQNAADVLRGASARGDQIECEHMWAGCRHDGVGSSGTELRCVFISPWHGYGHRICTKCGIDEFPHDKEWSTLVRNILEQRRYMALRAKAHPRRT